MALKNLEFNDQIGLIWRRTNRMGRRREERRREEEEEEEKKRRSGDQAKQAKGMETELKYGFMEF